MSGALVFVGQASSLSILLTGWQPVHPYFAGTWRYPSGCIVYSRKRCPSCTTMPLDLFSATGCSGLFAYFSQFTRSFDVATAVLHSRAFGPAFALPW